MTIVIRSARFLFMKIKEPRTVRLVQLGIYICMVVAGHYILASPPHLYQTVVGNGLVAILGGFLLFGGLVGSIAVLPGLWWLERLGVIALWTGLLLFGVIALAIGVSIVGFVTAIALALSLILRWFGIIEYDLAPRAE